MKRGVGGDRAGACHDAVQEHGDHGVGEGRATDDRRAFDHRFRDRRRWHRCDRESERRGALRLRVAGDVVRTERVRRRRDVPATLEIAADDVQAHVGRHGSQVALDLHVAAHRAAIRRTHSAVVLALDVATDLNAGADVAARRGAAGDLDVAADRRASLQRHGSAEIRHDVALDRRGPVDDERGVRFDGHVARDGHARQRARRIVRDEHVSAERSCHRTRAGGVRLCGRRTEKHQCYDGGEREAAVRHRGKPSRGSGGILYGALRRRAISSLFRGRAPSTVVACWGTPSSSTMRSHL